MEAAVFEDGSTLTVRTETGGGALLYFLNKQLNTSCSSESFTRIIQGTKKNKLMKKSLISKQQIPWVIHQWLLGDISACVSGKYIYIYFIFQPPLHPSASRAGSCDWQRGKLIADCVQWALGIFPPLVLRNPYVNSTLYWKYRMKSPPPPTPRWVLSNPQPHCLQLTVDFMSGAGISPPAQNTHLPFFPCSQKFQLKGRRQAGDPLFCSWESNGGYFLQCIVGIA